MKGFSSRYSDAEVDRVVDYFTRFHTAVFEYLAPHRVSVGNSFQRIAQENKTLVVAFTPDGYFARLLNHWTGQPVNVIHGAAFESATILPLGPLTNELKAVDFRFVFRGNRELTHPDMFGFTGPNGEEVLYPVPLNAVPAVKFVGVVNNTAFLHALPVVCKSSTGKRLRENEIGPREFLNAANDEFAVGWLFQWTSSRSDTLEGLDANPRIEAYSLVECILEQCGIIDEPPAVKYSRAASSLNQAMKSENSGNERQLQKVVEDYPWVLVEEPDIDRFLPEQQLTYAEVEIVDQAATRTERAIRPDFIYILHDGDCLIVEIEAASKEIMLTTSETGFQLFSAKANKALAQIRNYKSAIDRHGNAEICEQLACPSTTTFRYLLVVGSEDQRQFDERSFGNVAQQLAGEGIELRHWSYFIDRLKRREAAAPKRGEGMRP